MTPKQMSPERLEEARTLSALWISDPDHARLNPKYVGALIRDLLADRAAITAPVDDLEVQNALRNMAEACCCEPNKTCVPCKTADLLTRLSAALAAAKAREVDVRNEALEEAAKVALKVLEMPNDCESLGTMDMETGVSECSLESRGCDCLCAERFEEAERIATSIRALKAPRP